MYHTLEGFIPSRQVVDRIRGLLMILISSLEKKDSSELTNHLDNYANYIDKQISIAKNKTMTVNGEVKIYMHLASAVCLVSFIIYSLSISQLIYCVMTAILVGSQFCNVAFLLKCTCVKHCHIRCSQEDNRTASSARNSL